MLILSGQQQITASELRDSTPSGAVSAVSSLMWVGSVSGVLQGTEQRDEQEEPHSDLCGRRHCGSPGTTHQILLIVSFVHSDRRNRLSCNCL